MLNNAVAVKSAKNKLNLFFRFWIFSDININMNTTYLYQLMKEAILLTNKIETAAQSEICDVFIDWKRVERLGKLGELARQRGLRRMKKWRDASNQPKIAEKMKSDHTHRHERGVLVPCSKPKAECDEWHYAESERIREYAAKCSAEWSDCYLPD